MPLPIELKSKYQAVMAKAQAVQICGDKDPACPVSFIHDLTVKLYTAKVMHDDTKVKELVESLNKYLDGLLLNANPVTRTEVLQYLIDMQESSWMYQKTEDMLSRLNHIIKAQELMENKVEVKAPVKEAKVTKEVLKKQEKPEHIKKIKGKYQCKKCKRILDKEDFRCQLSGTREGRLRSNTCMKCERTLA